MHHLVYAIRHARIYLLGYYVLGVNPGTSFLSLSKKTHHKGGSKGCPMWKYYTMSCIIKFIFKHKIMYFTLYIIFTYNSLIYGSILTAVAQEIYH